MSIQQDLGFMFSIFFPFKMTMYPKNIISVYGIQVSIAV